jgi:zinc transporter, ZIP family
MNPLINIFILSLLAGLATGIGGLIAMIGKPGKRLFGFLMGLTAGVMITLSFLELVNESWKLSGYLTTTIGFALGALFMFLIDFFIPHIHFKEKENNIVDSKLFKTGVLTAIGIAIHNIPEGIAIGAGYMLAPKFGVFVAIAIALHNIPEGIATALPLCKSGLSKWKSFKVTLFSGLVEPIGALIAAVFLVSYTGLMPYALAFAGGVMVFITLDEIIPCAREHGHHHFTAIGIILGAIMVFLLAGIFGV